MIDFSDLLICVVVFVLLAPGLMWLVEVSVGLFPMRPVRSFDQIISSLVLIPAHNEERVIESTLRGLSAQLTDLDRVLVVADNCSDRTADIARECGANVVERHHDYERGKGFALAHGIEQIANQHWNPDVVIVLDADCQILSGGLKCLKQAALISPVQGCYLLTSPKEAAAKQRVSEFAIYVKNHIRLLGLARLGGSVPITGSGFGAPYLLFKRAELASGEIVEDMKLGCDWAIAGHFTKYAPHVQILSPLPVTDKDADTQRERWEHGHVGIIRRYVPKLLRAALKRLRFDYLFTALDMAVPPLLSMLVMYIFLAVILLPISVSASLGVLFYLTLVAVILVMINMIAKPKPLTFYDILGVLKFVLSKFTVYRKLLVGERSGWVKTKRDDSTK